MGRAHPALLAQVREQPWLDQIRADARTEPAPLRVLSLGAGVQSTTLLLMSLAGDLEPLDAAIFADTGWEPQAVYAHLERLQERCQAAGLPLVRVSAGNLRDLALSSARNERRDFPGMPFFAAPAAGQPSTLLKRQCTRQHKIRPIRRALRALMTARGASRVEQWIGISLDEVERLKPSGVRYVANRWPLIERRMTRQDCLAWMERHGEDRPPRSACLGCPLKGNAEWRALRDDSPAEWAETVAFDAAIRSLPRIRGEVFLHRSLVPLDQVDLSTPQDHGQLDLFGEECAGVCGV